MPTSRAGEMVAAKEVATVNDAVLVRIGPIAVHAVIVAGNGPIVATGRRAQRAVTVPLANDPSGDPALIGPIVRFAPSVPLLIVAVRSDSPRVACTVTR